MSRRGVTAALLLALAAGCSNQSERDLAVARLENEALRAEVDKHKADAASARAELAKARDEADEKFCRETAEFYMAALSQSDKTMARSVCTADQAAAVYVLSKSGWGWKITSQTVTPERDQVLYNGTCATGTFKLRLVRQGTSWKVAGFIYEH
jgi:hypothetical protein